MTNTEGPKKIWVPKKMIFPVVVVLDNKKQMPAMVPIQWLLTTYDERKLCVPMLDSLSWWNNHFWRESKGKINYVGKKCIHLYPSIDNVLFVEGLKHNLPSISQFCEG